MKKKAELVYFNEQWEMMLLHLKAFMKTEDQEALHQFRVQIKKIRALLLLLDATAQRNKLSTDFKPVRKLFKQCGDIRNAHINLQLAARYGLDNELFIDSQQSAIKDGISEFKQSGRSQIKAVKEANRAIKHHLKSAGNAGIAEFYKTHIEQIANKLDHVQFDDDLHDCRKLIKILMYNRKIAHKALEDRLPVNSDYLDKLQSYIGDWHDNILAIALFSVPGVNGKPAVARIRKENSKLKKSIRTMAKDFWKKATLYGNALNERGDEQWVLR